MFRSFVISLFHEFVRYLFRYVSLFVYAFISACWSLLMFVFIYICRSVFISLVGVSVCVDLYFFMYVTPSFFRSLCLGFARQFVLSSLL